MRRNRKSKIDKTIEDLTSLPWWVSVVVGGTILVGFSILTATSGSALAGHLAPTFLWLVILIFGGTAIGSVVRERGSRTALMNTKNIDDLRKRGWQAFETVTAAYYRERGYTVVQTGAAGPDGGYDVVLRRAGKRLLVQCKCYARDPISVEKVRELLGVVAAEGADRGIFITTSSFTPAALEFGRKNTRLELIAGGQFVRMVASVQKKSPGPSWDVPTAPQSISAPHCPRCAAKMVLREAKRGRWMGQNFWGCPGYPRCDGIRQVV